MKKIGVALLGAAFSLNVHAAWYQVEIILFEHLYPDAGGEVWHAGQGLPDVQGSMELVTDSAAGDVPFLLLRSGQHKLEGVYRALRSSRSYRPILHLAWQQPGYGAGAGAKKVHIRDTLAARENPEEAPVRVDGSIRLRVSRFLHADVDLAYFFQPVPGYLVNGTAETLPVTGETAQYSRLRESRRMKLNELHYFDHPLFGLFMRVSRFGGE